MCFILSPKTKIVDKYILLKRKDIIKSMYS